MTRQRRLGLTSRRSARSGGPASESAKTPLADGYSEAELILAAVGCSRTIPAQAGPPTAFARPPLRPCPAMCGSNAAVPGRCGGLWRQLVGAPPWGRLLGPSRREGEGEGHQRRKDRPLCVIAADFSLEFAGFFPREKSGKTRGKSGVSRKKSGKKYRFFPSVFSSKTAF